jgi:hypothetical protein
VSRFAVAGFCGLPVFHNRAYHQIYYWVLTSLADSTNGV